MPIHDLGYRPWKGNLTSSTSRWFVIAQTGAQRVWQSAWIRRIVFFAWLPLLFLALIFMTFEFAAGGGPLTQGLTLEVMDNVLGVEGLPQAPGPEATAMLKESRHKAWLNILAYYLRFPQGLALVLTIGLIAPRLISEDASSRAFLFYFSRPLSRLEYLIGKFVTIALFLAAITTIPALVAYAIAVALASSPDVLAETWDIPFRILAASFSVIVPAAAISLCFSSLTRDSRFAGFAWFTVWIFGVVTWAIVWIWRWSKDLWPEGHRVEEYVSLHHIFGAVQEVIFGLDSFSNVWLFVAILTVATIVSLVVLFQRVSSPMKA